MRERNNNMGKSDNEKYHNKMASFLITATVMIGVLMSGCNKAEEEGVALKLPKKAPAQVQAPVTTINKTEYIYSSSGKRDPFKPFLEMQKKTVSAFIPLTPLQAYDLKELKLVGVIILPGNKIAMIEDPTGKGYNVKIGAMIGKMDGRIADILKNEVLVDEKYYDETGKMKTVRVPIKMPKEGGEGQ